MFSNATPNRTADPWPRRKLTKEEWNYIEALVLKRVIRIDRWLAEHPRRAFPARAWVQEQEGLRSGWCALDARPHTPLRIDTAQLPVTTLRAWSDDFEQRYVYTLSPFSAEGEQAPTPKKTTRKQSKLEIWLDDHRGALKLWKRKPAQPAGPKSPYPLDNLPFPFPKAESRDLIACHQCHELVERRNLWESNEGGTMLCGKCWLEQESWAR